MKRQNTLNNCNRSLREHKQDLPRTILSADKTSLAACSKIKLNVTVVQLSEHFPCRFRDLRHQRATRFWRCKIMMRKYYLCFYYAVWLAASVKWSMSCFWLSVDILGPYSLGINGMDCRYFMPYSVI